jgi:hypothetical protein
LITNGAKYNLLTLTLIRYDYFPSVCRFVLRMPRLLHDQLAGSVAEDLRWQLRSIASGTGPATIFAQETRNTVSATIEFPGSPAPTHSPDGSIKHVEAKYPGVVIEVSYSQKMKDLPLLASDYIIGSRGSIRAVVGIDLEYTGKKATLSVWRPQIRRNKEGRKRIFIHRAISKQVCLL